LGKIKNDTYLIDNIYKQTYKKSFADKDSFFA